MITMPEWLMIFYFLGKDFTSCMQRTALGDSRDEHLIPSS